MSDLDDLLEKQLEGLEAGKPLEAVLAELPQEASELASLLRIASTIRALPHPRPATVMARAELESAVVNEKTRPVANPRILNPAPRILSPQPRILMPQLRILEDQLRILGAQLRIWLTPLRLGVALSMATAAMVMLLALVALFALGPTGARAATVMDVSGIVRVASGPPANNWKAVSDGDKVHAGQSIVTGSDSTLTLVFFEGSRMTLAPNSYITLTKLDGNWSKSLRLVVTQTSGKTAHSVVPLRGAKSAYQVITPAGVASVHGTKFTVAVGADGVARFAVNTGKVVVNAPEAELALEAGQVASTKPGLLPETPDYQFDVSGQLTSIDGDIWSVNGVSFTVSTDTQITGDPVVGSFVEVEGRITQEGERLADSATVVENDTDKTQSTFTGILQTIKDDTWLVDGVAIHVDGKTEQGEGIELGKPVKVVFYVAADGRWMASEIEALEEEPETESETEPETEEPASSESPETSEIVTAAETEVPAAIVNCTGANPHPKGTSLAGQYGVPPDEIMGWFCQHFGFGEIDLAYGLSQQYGISAEQIFALRRTRLGWGQIKKMLASGEVTPTDTPSPEDTSTEVLATSPVPSESPEPSPVPPKNDRSCPQQDNPSATRLAGQYTVPPEEIMGWFCKGFGFGEIDQAYSLSKLYPTVPVGEIFGMRSSGMGWGAIKKKLSAPANLVPMVTQESGNGQGNPGHTPPGHDIPGHHKPPKKK